jgi:hypothetical protein
MCSQSSHSAAESGQLDARASILPTKVGIYQSALRPVDPRHAWMSIRADQRSAPTKAQTSAAGHGPALPLPGQGHFRGGVLLAQPQRQVARAERA